MSLRHYGNGYSRDTDSPMWLDDETWVCRRHLPSARFNKAQEKCLYGCAHITRPPLDQRPGVKAKAAEAKIKVEVSPAPKLNGAKRVVKLRALTSEDRVLYAGIPEEEAQKHKRQGRTARVACKDCGKVIFRRQVDVRTRGTDNFTCGRACTGKT